MGATGRVSQLLLAHWRIEKPAMTLRTQSRTNGYHLTWSPLDDGSEPLCQFVDRESGIDTVIALIGATPSTCGDVRDAAALSGAVLEAAAKAGVRRVLFASSSAVYSLGEGLAETDPTDPVNPYGHGKLDMEAVIAASDAHVDTCCLRIGNVAGADALLGRAHTVSPDKPLQIDRFPDGKGPRRSYIGPASLARCLERLVMFENALPDILNLAATSPIEMADLAQAAGLPWHWVPAPTERFGTQRITLNCSALAGIMGADSLAATADTMVAELRNLGALA
ncbi:NAD-dependent epimerase/dehydratase family protein [Litoreibacter janthinus]|nr:NAD-dependent epimerase/dehydratase [Litoreibacter janthinus]